MAMTSLSCTVGIDRPVDVVYEAWTQSARIPTFMGGRAEQRPTDAGSMDWVSLIEGRSRDFGAEETERLSGSRIAWSGRGRPHRGAVTFAAVADEHSQVTVELDWEPSDGAELVDRLILRRGVQEELDGFRRDLTVGSGAGAAESSDSGTEPAVTGHRPGDRGQGADSPAQIPAKGWLDIAKRTGKQVVADNVSIVAGGVAFYVFVALVPTLIAVISLYGLVANPVDVARQLGPFLAALPPDAADLVRNQVEAITGQEETSLGFGLAIGVIVALVGASKGMLALVSALNIAFDETETRKFVPLRGVALLLTVGLAIGTAVGVGGMVLVQDVAASLGDLAKTAVTVLRWPVLALLVVLGLAALYRYAPDRSTPKWRWVTPGAVVATLLWLVGSIAFSVYVTNFGSYNETYGTLGAVVVLLLWLLLSAYAVVLGAEFDGEIERQTVKDSTEGGSQPLGQRGSYAADTVASDADLAGAGRH